MPVQIRETQYDCDDCNWATTSLSDLRQHPHPTRAFNVIRCTGCGEIRYLTASYDGSDHECID